MRISLGFTLLVGTILSVLASAVLLYISIATMIGPWIAPTLVLISSVLFSYLSKRNEHTPLHLIMISALASGGGIVAVGIGFSLPMLYFLAPAAFNHLMISPSHFIIRLGGTVLLAGAFGIFLGKFFSKILLKKDDLAFPISSITHQIATAQSHKDDSRNLFKGVLSTLLLCFLRDGFYSFKGFFAKEITLFSTALTGPLIFSLWPTLWAIGFTVGLSSTIPLFIGLVARHLILQPINYHSLFLPFSLFAPLKEESFITAFCSGMIVSEIILASLFHPKAVITYFKKYIGHLKLGLTTHLPRIFKTPLSNFLPIQNHFNFLIKCLNSLEPIVGLCSFFLYFSILQFSISAQLVILISMSIALYEINRLCGKIGLLQMGRFSAFILIPVVVLFKINALQMTALTIFFNVAAGISSDLLFDYKTAELGAVNRNTVHALQWLGLFVSSITVAIICYLLFSNLTLGSAELFAHRGRSKALLMQSLHFDYYIITLGFIFGWILKKCKISPTMAFGGMIMPSQITLGFVFGGIISQFVGDKKERLLPFCSGVFATETLLLLLGLSLRVINNLF
ncbi:hypothetical protein FJ364_05065 [Candidatus Dependentiae bacterium]|nr:hypothetical protein [Candidatus Dependentiae bacterium]